MEGTHEGGAKEENEKKVCRIAFLVKKPVYLQT